MAFIKKYNDFIIENSSYIEGEDSTFIHNDIEYSVDKAIEICNDYVVDYLPTDALKWIIEFSNLDLNRVVMADINIPIIVCEQDGVYYVLDGAHRLSKAILNNVEYIPVKIITDVDLDKCKI